MHRIASCDIVRNRVHGVFVNSDISLLAGKVAAREQRQYHMHSKIRIVSYCDWLAGWPPDPDISCQGQA
jgi:hypothetical protein